MVEHTAVNRGVVGSSPTRGVRERPASISACRSFLQGAGKKLLTWLLMTLYYIRSCKDFLVFEPAVASSERINRETGESPVRSRHCERESQNKVMSLGESLGRRFEMLNLSQENCL